MLVAQIILLLGPSAVYTILFRGSRAYIAAVNWVGVRGSHQGCQAFFPQISDLFRETRCKESSPCSQLNLGSSRYQVLYFYQN